MESSDSRIKDELSEITLLSTTSKEQQLSEIGKETLEEVTKEPEFTSKSFENISERSSDSFVIEEKEEEINLETCSVRAYIEHTVGQILLTALTILERERPENPVKWLAQFLLFNKDQPDEMMEPPEQETFEPIKLPDHVKKVIIEDLQDLDIAIVNKLV